MSLPPLDPLILKASRENRLVLFTGAGLSCAAGLGSWQDLKKRLVEEFRPKRGEDGQSIREQLMKEAGYYRCFRQIRERDETTYNEVMKSFLEPSPAARAKFNLMMGHLMALKPVSIVTLNIDSLILDSNPYGGWRSVRGVGKCWPWEIPDGRLFCFHGIEDSGGGKSLGWVFDSEDLEARYARSDSAKFLHVLFSGHYVVLFVGFSFSDELLLRHAQLPYEARQGLVGGSRPVHFALLPSNHQLQPRLDDIGARPLLYDYVESGDDMNLAHQNFEKTIASWASSIDLNVGTGSLENADIPEAGPDL